MQTSRYDVVVIGAGIVGCLVARELSRFDITVALIEKAEDVGTGASAANSAILHAGHDPLPGTLKASLNVRGNALWRHIADELEIRHDRCGSLIVATEKAQIAVLSGLLDRAERNGVPGARILGRDQSLTREPLLHPATVATLWTPSAGIIDPFGAVLAAAENAVRNGVVLELGARVTAIARNEYGDLTVTTDRGAVSAHSVVNCAGIHSDEILHLTGDRPDLHLNPRRGEYFALDPARVRVTTVLFPVPSSAGKGTLVAPTAHGNTMIGPNAHFIPEKEDTATTASGLEEIFKNARMLVPSIERGDIIASFAGIRASRADESDFLIEPSRATPGVIHTVGIDSPGFVSAPAIAERVVELLRETGIRLEGRPGWNPYRIAPPAFRHLSHDERASLIAGDATFGRIVCRCQNVTEGEVVAAIHGTIPARSYDAIKRRCWVGTGRCQGGFDYNRIINILARELGIPVEEIRKNGAGSSFVFRGTKEAPQEAIHANE